MGFFDDMKKGFSDLKQGIQEQQAAAHEAQVAQRDAFAQQLKIIGETPQDEVDRINAGDGPGRAVVIGVSHNLEDGESSFRTNATAYLRLRQTGGGLGPEQKVKLWIDSGTIRSMRAGLEVPVQYDRATGLIVPKPDMKAIAAEVKALKKSGGF